MKKFLLSIFAMMLAVFSVQAEEVTFIASGASSPATNKVTLNGNLPSGNSDYVDFSMTKVNSSTSNVNSGLLRWYKNDIVNLTPKAGVKITKVVITMGSESKYQLNVKPNVGSSSITNGVVTWTGETSETLKLTADLGQVRFSTLTVTYTVTGESGGETPEPIDVAEPTFTPASGTTFEDNLNVTINTEDDLIVYYSTDEEKTYTPGNSVNIKETTTVYAYAEDADGNKSDVVRAEYTKVVPVDPNAKEVEATISFANTAQRLSQNSNSQVWANGGVTFTNNKAASQSNVVGNTNPVRLYASSELVIECAGNITKIVFDCNSTSYATALKNSIGDAATASSDKVTVTLNGTSNSFTVAKLSAQVRMDEMTVTYLVSASQEEKPAAPTFSVETGTKFYPTLELEISAAEGADIYYTLNGKTPTKESDAYSTPITIKETTVVKAIAVVNGVESEVAAASYKKVIESVTGNVADAFNYYVGGEQIPAVITGYIVGAVNGTSFGDGGENCKFDVTEIENAANILIADNADETDYTKCLVVQLPSGSIRDALNLVDNPNNYKNKVVLTATLETYFSVAGLRSTSAYEFIPEYTLSVTNAGWATLFLDFNATIPTNVEAYTVTGVETGYVTLTPVTGVLPANTGIIVNAEEGNYTFNYAKEATASVDDNLLKGSATATEIEEDAYVLSIVDGEVGLYKALASGTSWKNNANKAYLPIASGTALSASLRFDFGGTTGVEKVEIRNEKEEIYDLTGRRVNEITKAGVYIIGGRKVLVK